MKKLLFVLITAFFLSGHAFALNWSNGGGGGEAGTTVGGLTPDTIEAGDDGKYLLVDWGNSKIDYGTPAGGGDMSAAVWDGDTDGFIDADAGGTDIDTSAATGTARVDAGTWSINAAISGTTVDASTDFTVGGTVITDATITDDGTLVLAPTTAVSFSDKPITNVGSIALDSIAADGAAAALTITATAGQVVSVESVTMDGGALNAASIGAGTPGTIVGTTIDAGTDFTVGGTIITDATITDDGTLTVNPTTLLITADISTTGAQDWDLIDNNASGLSFDAAGKAGIINIITTDAGEGVTMSGTLGVTGAATVGGTLGVTGVLTATAAGANITAADGQLIDLSGITHTGAADEGLVLPTWADVAPAGNAGKIAWDTAASAVKVYDGGWISFAAVAAPLDAKYITQTADATLTAEQALGALGSGILYSTTTTGVVSIATEAQLETLMGLGFGASKAATSGYIFVADGTDFESVEMSGDVTIATGGATTVGDDSHAHVVGNIDSANSAAWAGQVSDETGTGLMVFATAPTFTTSIAFNAVTDTVAGIQNQNLLDKTAAETVSGVYTHSANIDLDDGTGASPSLIFTDATNETFTITKADGGNLDIDVNNAADRVVDLANAGAGDVNVTLDGDLTVGGILTVTGVANDHYMDLVTNAATPPNAGTNSIYTVNNVIKFAEGGVEKDPVLEADSVTWTGTTHSFAGVTNMVLPTAAADASGEISMSAGNQLTWHDGTKVVNIDTTVTTDNYVLKYDNATATFNLEADATGGTPAWDDITDSTGAMAVTSGTATETTTFTQSADDTEWLFDYTAAFTVAASPSLFKIIQQTGNAEAVTLVDIQASDSDVIVLAAGDGTNEWQISQPGRLSNNGTADFNLAAATDLLVGGAQIDFNDMAGLTDITTAEDLIIGDAKYIGSTSDPDAIQIEADGDMIFSQDLDVVGALTGNSVVSDGGLTGTFVTINHATPSIILNDTGGADGLIDGNAADADDFILSMKVDDSGGDDQTYIELDGVTETIDLLQNTVLTGTFTDGTATLNTGVWSAVEDVLLADGAVVGISGNEIMTFNAAGNITVSGAALDLTSGGITNSGTIADDGAISVISSGGTVTIESVVFTGGAMTAVTNITSDAAEINGTITLANDETIVNSTDGTIGFGAANLVSTGTIQAGIVINNDADGMSQAEMTTVGMYGSAFFAGGAATWLLPDALEGMSFCVYSTTAAAVVLNPDDNDDITLDGTLLANGDSVTSESAAGDFICMVAQSDTHWFTLGRSGTWTDTN